MRPEANPLQPSSYQQEAIERGRRHFRENKRGSLIAACGAGKTLVSIKIAEEFSPPAKKVLVTVPTRLLLKQAIEDWKRNFDPERELDIVAVCSDEAVAGDVTDEEIAEEGALVTTCDDELQEALTTSIPPGRVKLVVSTYQSMPIVAAAQKGVRYDSLFDLLIVDEAHRTAGQGKEIYQLPVDGKEIRAARRLFMTATPRIVKPRDRDDRDSDDLKLKSFGVDSGDVYSMDNPDDYGDIFYEITLAQAIGEREVPVSPYRVVPHVARASDIEYLCEGDHELPYAEMFRAEMSEDPGITTEAQKLIDKHDLDREAIRGTGQDGRIKVPDVERYLEYPDAAGDRNMQREVAMERVAAAYILQHALDNDERIEAPKVISYHRRLDRARRLQDALDELNTHRGEDKASLVTAYLDGEMSMEEYHAELDRFTQAPESTHAVLTNCKALTEGMNVDGANALMFADPKGSTIEIMQAIGRIIRRGGDDGKVGIVILPILVDDREPESPRVTEESRKRLRRLLFAGKQIDDKIARRIAAPELVPPHPDDTRGCESPIGARVARMKHEELGRFSREAVDELLGETLEDIKSIAGRDYYGVRWDESRGEWLARVQNPWFGADGNPGEVERYGRERTIALGTYPSPEEAAETVDDFIRENELAWLPNFGHNPHLDEQTQPQKLTSRFPRKISFASSRGPEGECRAYIDAELTNARGEPYEVKINNYHRTGEMDAALAHDAFCMRYGFPARQILDPAKHPTRYDLIVSGHPQKVVEEGIEEDWYLHRPDTHPERYNPEKKYWAYVRDEDGVIHPLGNFPTVEASRAARDAVLEEIGREPAETWTPDQVRERFAAILDQAREEARPGHVPPDPTPPAETPEPVR